MSCPLALSGGMSPHAALRSRLIIKQVKSPFSFLMICIISHLNLRLCEAYVGQAILVLVFGSMHEFVQQMNFLFAKSI